ncbi:MAG: FGGY family carbohydrate kinase, partial [Akkermansiaceae bacterium]
MADGAVFLAVDLGAGSGRIIAGLMLGGRLSLEEVYRFKSEPVEKSGNLYWDFEGLLAGVLEGLRLSVVRYGAENISSIGVDTWGVDYGFIDKSGQLLGKVRHYRDPRTKNMYEDLAKHVSKDVIFEKTGIQFMNINTLPQMRAEVKDPDSLLPLADQFLMVPDLINLSLTGQAFCERTNASTTQLYNPTKKDWSRTLFEALQLPLDLAPKFVSPGTNLGMVKASVRNQTGISAETNVVTVGAHDTASAVAAVPAKRGTKFAYLSSGTWSLLGVELKKPIITPLARSYNFTNEVGVFDTIRLLKNINGLWVVQECRRVWKTQGNNWCYRELAEMALGAKRLQSFIDPDDERFAGRCNMPLVIQDY